MPDYPQNHRQKSKLFALPVFYTALWREFALNGVLVFAIMMGIVIVSQLIRLLGHAVSGRITVDAVLTLLGMGAVKYMPILLSICLFISVLLTLSRSFRDSEMVVWYGAGIGLTRWIRPAFWFALPVIMLIGMFSLVLSPWAMNEAERYKQSLKNRDDVAAATPGIFRESSQADRVYFIENVQLDNDRVGNVFVQSMNHGRQSIMVAREGMRETRANGDRYLILFNGIRYEGVPGQLDYRIVSFERYSMKIDRVTPPADDPSVRAKPLLDLVQQMDSTHQAELIWRVGMPVSALILVMLAIPLSYVNPRAGRSFNLIVAIVLYVIYNNLLNVATTWVGQEKIPALAGLAGVHLIMLMVALVLFYRRIKLFSWRRCLPQRQRKSAAEEVS